VLQNIMQVKRLENRLRFVEDEEGFGRRLMSYRADSTHSRSFNVFILLNGWICLHGGLDEAGSYSVFECT